MNAVCYIEIGQDAIHALYGERSIELPLERTGNGRLTNACRQRLQARFRELLLRSAWLSRPRVICAIGVKGVTVRRLVVPAASKETLHRVLGLQIESEFPLPPDQLAWGYQCLGQAKPKNGSPPQQDLLVMAVRREVVEDYAQLFPEGVAPDFTLAALARSYLCSVSSGHCGILEVGKTSSEWIEFEGGVPTAVRALAWGDDTVARSIAEQLNVSIDEAQRLRSDGTTAAGHAGTLMQAALGKALDSLAVALGDCGRGGRLYLAGLPTRQRGFPSRLGERLGGVVCEPLEPVASHGSTAALGGLKVAAQNGNDPLLLRLHDAPQNGSPRMARPTPWKWVGLAALLLAGLLTLPYVEALLLKPGLARKLAALKADRGRLDMIDRELEFLRYLKQNQPPYLDTVYLMAKCLPTGGRIESLSMNRRGELALRGSLKDSMQVAEFRGRLIQSGLFTNVTVEEQSPTPDKQKLNVRLSAQWKPAAERQGLTLGPSPEEIERAKTAKKEGPRGGGPTPRPPGVVVPVGSPAGTGAATEGTLSRPAPPPATPRVAPPPASPPPPASVK